ncbi:MAG: MFS transporter [Anaerolineae bacterium]|nr:MFS transporter [Anaerolineae bacterium]
MSITDNRKRNRILTVLFIGVLMGALDIAIVAPALPALQAGFGVGDRILAWTFTIYVLFNLIGTPLMAKLSDRTGRRTIYVLDVALFAAGSLVVALSSNFAVLLIGRAMQGLGAGGIFPVASAVIGDTFPPEKRGSALGLIGAVFGLAFLIGPILGGVLLGLFGWRSLFLINLPIAVIVIVLALATLPSTRPTERRPFDWIGMTVLGVLLASLAFGINQLDTTNFGASLVSRNVWAPLLLTIILIPVFVAAERRAADPVLRLSILGPRQAKLAAALSAGAGLGEAGMVFMPQLAVAALGLGRSQASYILMPVVLAMAFGSPMSGRFLDKLGSKVVVFVGTTLLTLGMILLGLFNSSLGMFIVSGVVIGLGLSALLGAPIRYIMLNETATADRAAAQGVTSLFTSTGQLLSGVLVGAVAASQGSRVAGYSAAFLVIGAVSFVLILLSLALKSRAAEVATMQRIQDVASVGLQS